MKILIYEDSSYGNLFPLNLLRANYDLRCGANTIKERIENISGNKFEIILHCRNVLSKYISEVHKNKINQIAKDDYLLLNGRVIFTGDLLKYLFTKKEKNSYYKYKDEIIAAYITKDRFEFLKEKVEDKADNIFTHDFFSFPLKKAELGNDNKTSLISYPWDLLHFIISGGLEDDIQYYLRNNKKCYKLKDKENFINHKKILAAKTAKIFPSVVIDATKGFVVIADNVVIEPFTFIKGPAFIGNNSLLKSGTKIYGPCVLGEYSKVAGEIGESIFHSYVNKQHDGFVGHSYICPFVNLGADTVTSDLKNNYSKIRVKISEEEMDTGMQFLGSIIGDHSKTSVNTMLNTGSVIGIFANIFGGGFPEKFTPSFSWSDAGKSIMKYDLDKAFETSRIVMQRRGITMSKSYEELVKFYY